MATFRYNHAVKINGKIVPPDTPVDIENEPSGTEKAEAETVKTTVKRRTVKKKE